MLAVASELATAGADGDFQPPFETFSSALELLIGCTEPVADEQAEVVMSAHSSRRPRSRRT